MAIYNTRELRIRYENLLFCDELERAFPSVHEEIEKRRKELKHDIRKFNKKTSDRRYIRGDSDYYIELIELPERIKSKQAASDYFQDKEFIQARPSAYDCTGQAFTSWVKFVKRNGKYYAYHEVSFDV